MGAAPRGAMDITIVPVKEDFIAPYTDALDGLDNPVGDGTKFITNIFYMTSLFLI